VLTKQPIGEGDAKPAFGSEYKVALRCGPKAGYPDNPSWLLVALTNE